MNRRHQVDQAGVIARHTGRKQRSVAMRLAVQQQQAKALQDEVDGLARQSNEIDRFLQGLMLANRVIDRAALFMLQQRQAVLRQRRYQLQFEGDRLREQLESLAQEQEATRIEMQQLMRKQAKFERWSAMQKRQQMSGRLLREDQEIEDTIAGKCQHPGAAKQG